MQIVRVGGCVMLTVIKTPNLGYIDKRCLTPGCGGDRLSMHRCDLCGESLMRRLRRTEARKLWDAKPLPQGGPIATKSHTVIFQELRDHPGSTVADLVMRSEFSRATVKRALIALVAVGDARLEPGSGRGRVYFLAGVL